MKKTKTLVSRGRGARNALVILATVILFGFTSSCSRYDKEQIANYAWEEAEQAEFEAMRYGNGEAERLAIVVYAWEKAAKAAQDAAFGQERMTREMWEDKARKATKKAWEASIKRSNAKR
jgi:hypothetical protein